MTRVRWTNALAEYGGYRPTAKVGRHAVWVQEGPPGYGWLWRLECRRYDVFGNFVPTERAAKRAAVAMARRLETSRG